MSLKAASRLALLRLRDVETVYMKKIIDNIANNMIFVKIFLQLTIFGMSSSTHCSCSL